MHVLFVVPRFHTNLAFAVRALRSAGHRVSIFANAASPGEDHSTVAPRLFGDTPRYAAVAEAMVAARPDLCFLRNAVALSRHATVAAARAGIATYRYNQTPVTEHSAWRARLALRLKRLPLRRVTPVRGLDGLAPSDPWATYLPWPVDRVDPTAVRTGTSAPLRLLCVGKFAHPKKNQLDLLHQIERAGLASQIALTLVGSAPEGRDADRRDYAERVRHAAARIGATLRTNVPFAEMGAIYRAADICVLPSRFEKLGSAPLEAMAHGCVPMISSACGSAGSLTHGVDGVRVDPDRPGAFAEAIANLAADRRGLAALSRGALATAAGDLGWARFVERVETLAAAAPHRYSVSRNT